MDIEKDLKIIERVVREKNDENWEFRSFLKRHDYEIEKLDAIAHRITDEVWAHIDCTQYGNCCLMIDCRTTAVRETYVTLPFHTRRSSWDWLYDDEDPIQQNS